MINPISRTILNKLAGALNNRRKSSLNQELLDLIAQIVDWKVDAAFCQRDTEENAPGSGAFADEPTPPHNSAVE